MKIIVTNKYLLEQIEQELSDNNELVVQTNLPLKKLTFSHKDTNAITSVLLLEKWNDKALRGKEFNKIYTDPVFYEKNSKQLLHVVAGSSINSGTPSQIIIQVG